MSPLLIFLLLIVSLTGLIVAYFNKQFQTENLIYSQNQNMTNSNTNPTLKSNQKSIEKEKVIAETLNGRFAMLGLIAALGAYLTTGQIIPGFV